MRIDSDPEEEICYNHQKVGSGKFQFLIKMLGMENYAAGKILPQENSAAVDINVRQNTAIVL